MKIFAIVLFKGKQYRVEKGTLIPFRNNQIGKRIKLSKVLLLATKTHTIIGRPIIKDASVIGETTGDYLHIVAVG